MVGPTRAATLFQGITTPCALHSDWIERSSFLWNSTRSPAPKCPVLRVVELRWSRLLLSNIYIYIKEKEKEKDKEKEI